MDIAVLSHGHYDHGGGISIFLEVNKNSKIYANENVFGDYYNGTEKYIGLNKELQGNNQILLVGDEFEIREGINLYSQNKSEKIVETNAFGLKKSEKEVDKRVSLN